MNLVETSDSSSLADCAARLSIDCLKATLEQFGEAIWVASGGSTPAKSYEIFASHYNNGLDWTKVWFTLGDERHVQLSDSDSNWGKIEQQLLSKLAISPDHKIVPTYNQDLSVMAQELAAALEGRPRFDLIWLGLGEDGHTLSLFPGHHLDTKNLVETVTNSPKPPQERITLSLEALKRAKNCLVLASGKDKAQAVAGLMNNDETLPITLAVKVIELSGGQVSVVVDRDAASLIK